MAWIEPPPAAGLPDRQSEEGGVAASGLTCEQCGAAVEVDATVCFTCGAPIGDIETPTRPVPVPRFLRTKILTEVTLESEEPAEDGAASGHEAPMREGARGADPSAARGTEGVPAHDDGSIVGASGGRPKHADGAGRLAEVPAHTTDRLPEVPAHGDDGALGPEPIALVMRARATATLAHLSVVRRQLTTDATALANTARQASRLSWTLLGISVVVIALGLVVLSYRLIPGSVPAQTIYRDPHGRFSFAQPALWQAASATDSVTLTDATGISTARITVTLAHGQETAAEAADLVGASDGVIRRTTVRIEGVTWEERAGAVPLADGTTRYVAVYVTEHDSSFYIVECSTLAASYPSTNQLIFQPLLRSFTFG
jgi:hypothetical protein